MHGSIMSKVVRSTLQLKKDSRQLQSFFDDVQRMLRLNSYKQMIDAWATPNESPPDCGIVTKFSTALITFDGTPSISFPTTNAHLEFRAGDMGWTAPAFAFSPQYVAMPLSLSRFTEETKSFVTAIEHSSRAYVDVRKAVSLRVPKEVVVSKIDVIPRLRAVRAIAPRLQLFITSHKTKIGGESSVSGFTPSFE
mmetsp:Transcript_7963/g.19532  ORF Transcript_7963/g.19532 Transcript_7963/m.19532 type:complete len:194 (+) Transcript_7963:31-612(+)